MKMATKIKTRKTTKSKPKSRAASVSIVGAKTPVVRHFRIAEHKHTGKLIHHGHTSHPALVAILLFVGIFMFSADGLVGASGPITKTTTVSVGLVVLGPAPTEGAVITQPKDGHVYTDKTVAKISGTCPDDTFIVIKNNNILSGSTICDDNGKFSLEVQLNLGTNIFSALNYDNMNQAGPETSDVTVTSVKTPIESTATVIPVEPKPTATPDPVLPENPSIVPGAQAESTTCENYDPNIELPTGGDPHVSVICVPRLFLPAIQQTLGFLVWGGTPPYTVSVNWGSVDKISSTIHVTKPGYKTAQFTYTNPGIQEINFHLSDNIGKTAVVQTAVQVSGAVTTPVVPSATTGETYEDDPTVVIVTGNKIIDKVLGTSWFKTPVPLYLLAVAITFGFWGGDIFDRKFGSIKTKNRTRKAA